jgi:hypothetical protein
MLDVRTKSYEKRQEEWIKQNSAKVDDKVRVVRKLMESDLYWDGMWNRTMDKTVGVIGTITNIHDSGVTVEFGGDISNWWSYPYYLLEKVAAPAPTFQPGQLVLVRDHDEDCWELAHFAYYEDGADFPYNLISGGSYRFCISFAGNEHLLNTNARPEGTAGEGGQHACPR